VLHDLIVLAVVIVVAYLLTVMGFANFRRRRFRSKMEWWQAEGIIIFVLAFAALLLVALAGKFFHTLR
jgi:amino acid transporter